jgi:tripartite-type tricarboxylate transporter receptor subunit TctC
MIRLPALCLLVAVLPAPVVVGAQAFPVKPIRIIVPFPPGDTVDTMSRLIAPRLAERLGQPVLVDNRSGAAGQLGLELAARAAPDGYTLVIGQGGSLSIQPHTYKRLPYDPFRDFTPVALAARNFLALAVSSASPLRSVQDLLAYAKAHPGKLTLASNGEGGSPHISIERMRTAAGISYLHVPYKGSAQIITEIVGGRVDGTILGIGPLAPMVAQGRLRLLAVTSPARAALYPDVPALAETLPGFDSRGWFGYLGPAGLPASRVDLLNAEINRALNGPEVREKLESVGLTVMNDPPQVFARSMREEYETIGKVIRAIGLQPQ